MILLMTQTIKPHKNLNHDLLRAYIKFEWINSACYFHPGRMIRSILILIRK